MKGGPNIWKSIHYIALYYPEKPTYNDKQNYYIFFTNLATVLPCKKCQKNYTKNLIEYPIESNLESREKLFEWTVNIHNIVNKELGKKQMSLEKAYDIYKNDKIKYYDYNINYYILFILLIIVIIILIAYIYREKISKYFNMSLA